MVAHLVRLKLILTANGLRRSAWVVVGFVVGCLYGLGALVGSLAALGYVSTQAFELREMTGVLAGAGLVLLWWVVPLVAFGLVCFSVIWLRYQRPDLERHFKVPLFPVLPAVGVAICFWLAWDGATVEIRKWFGWFLLGSIALYFAYAYWASPLKNKPADEKAAG